jgi:deoxyribodipyrimidine photo-lyase
MARDVTILWFRRDLRLSDHRALEAAARGGEARVLGAFVADPTLLAHAGATRRAHLRATLAALDADMGGHLVVRVGEPADELPALARESGAREVLFTGDFGPYGRERDRRVVDALHATGVATRAVGSPYAVEPGRVRSASGTPYRVFTPFRRAWEPLALDEATGRAPVAEWVEAPSAGLDPLAGATTTRPWYFGDLPDDAAPQLPEAGEAAAHRLLASMAERVGAYGETRNRPDLDATSRLSPHLRFGTLHPRQVLAAGAGTAPGHGTFRAELAWREFYADVLWHAPRSAREPWRAEMARLRVDRDERAAERFRAWARGETGYPLVDAGMRQLLAEGWMHNRVRMVCASFLVKHLHLDWRWGARWFMWRLADADLASNQHGWQWCAGTGTDASPFDRVFNPTLQAQRFDPEGRYVRRYVAELAKTPAPACLEPGGAGILSPGYCAPLVDAATERAEALMRIAEVRAARGAS